MAIEFSCSCGQKFRVADEHAGRKTKCKGCGGVVAIPAKSAKPKAAAQPAARSAAPAAKKPARSEDEELFVLEPSDTDDASDDESEFDFAVEDTRPRKRLPGKPGAKKKKKRVDDDDDERPTKAKSKKKKSSKNEGIPKPALIAMFAIGGLIGLTGVGFAVVKMVGNSAAAKKPVEKEWANFKHELGNFSIDYPKDWTKSGKGGTGGVQPWALFEGDDATVRVRSDLGGSMVGTIAQNMGGGFNIPGGGEAELPDELDPIAAVHAYQVKDIQGDYNDYEETAPEVIKGDGSGEGRLSVFTGSQGFTKYKGIRASFNATNNQYNIVCKISASRYDKFEPVFRKMIASFKQ